MKRVKDLKHNNRQQFQYGSKEPGYGYNLPSLRGMAMQDPMHMHMHSMCMQYYSGGVDGVGSGSEWYSSRYNPHHKYCHDSPHIEDKNDDDKSRKKLDEMISPSTHTCKS
eukprot:2369256-Ditylum_brightwellii.AAC.2